MQPCRRAPVALSFCLLAGLFPGLPPFRTAGAADAAPAAVANPPSETDVSPALKEVQDALLAVTPEETAEVFARAQRFFDGGRFGEAHAMYEALLQNPHFGPLPPYTALAEEQRKTLSPDKYNQDRLARQADREKALFGQARCRFMQLTASGAPQAQAEDVQKAFDQLSRNTRGFEDPRFAKDALYWVARCQQAAGRPDEAVETLQRVLDRNPDGKLDWDAGKMLGQLLIDKAASLQPQSLAEEERVVADRRALHEKAAAELARVAEHYPDMDGHKDVELKLIELRMAIGQYREAFQLIELFGKRERETSAYRARSEMLRGQCLFFFGELEQAADVLEKVLSSETPDERTQIETCYSLGWCCWKLAAAAAADKRQAVLARSKTVFRRALQKMELNNPRRKPALRLYGQVLLELGDAAGALEQFREIIRDPRLHVQASFHAGRAARALGDTVQAKEYFENVVRGAEGEERQEYLLAALRELSSLSAEQSRFGEALLYACEAERTAALYLDEAALAEAGLREAQALTGLGAYDKAASDACAGRALETLVRLLGAAREEEPRTMEACGGELSFYLNAQTAYEGAGAANFDQALARIATLRKRLGARLRKDHLDFEEARAWFYRTETLRAAVSPDPQQAQAEYAGIVKGYDRAELAARQAAQANPHGTLAPSVNLFLGEIGFSHGTLAFRLAEMLTQAGQAGNAASLKEDGKQALEATLPAYEFVVFSPDAGAADRIKARTRMGEAYFQLEDYDKALLAFRTLAEDGSLERTQRIMATIRWARALASLNKPEQAIQKLQPYIGFNLEAALLAGDLYEQLGFFRHARDTFLTGYTQASEDSSRALKAEAAYRAYRLGLVRTGEVAESGDAQIVFEASAGALAKFAEEYADTVLASRALVDLGEALLKKNAWQEALEIAQRQIPRVGNHVDTLQALYLLRGRALLGGGKAEEALAAFGLAERIDTATERGRTQRAAAIREQGNAYAAMKDYDRALMQYGRVFAIFNREESESDLARLAAAEIYARQGDIARAHTILGEGHDGTLMREQRDRLDKKYGN